MKKLFVAAGIFTFSFAAAQQNDVFDIQGHIRKKLIEEQKKKLPVLSFRKNQPDIFLPNSNQQPSLLSKEYYTLSNGNKVFSLADGMSCIVPDMHQFNTINILNKNNTAKLNLYDNNLPGKIPNAYHSKK